MTRKEIQDTPESDENLGLKATGGSIIVLMAQLVRIVIQLASTAIFARMLAPADFGVFTIAALVVGFANVFTDLGLSAAVIQRQRIDQNTVSALFFVNVAAGLGIMLMVWAVAPIAAWFFDDPRVLGLLFALAPSIPLTACGAQHNALLVRGMRWRTIQYVSISSQIFGVVVGVAFAYYANAGYWALVINTAGAAFFSLILLWAVSHWRPSRVKDWSGVRSALAFGLNLTGFNLVNYFHRQADNILIGYRWGPTELGFYNRAYTLLSVPITLISGPIGSVLIPSLSRLQAEPERWRRAYLDALTLVAVLNSFISVALIANARPLIDLFLGPGWGPSADIFMLLANSMLFSVPSGTCGWILTSLGQTKRMFTWSLIATPLFVLAFLIGLPYGAKGVAALYSVAMALLSPAYFLFSIRQTNLKFSEIVRAVFPFLVAAYATLFLVTSISLNFGSSPKLLQIFLNTIEIALIQGVLSALVLFSGDFYRPFVDRVRNLFFSYLSARRV